MIRHLWRSLRPYQWTKNLLIFAALIFTKNVTHWDLTLRAALGFLAYCALSGAVYLVNDIADVAADREHPHKRFRPIAAGMLSINVAASWAAGLAGAGLAVGFVLDQRFAACQAAYLILNLLYTRFLKHMVILDVLVIAIGFVLRAMAGAYAIDVKISPWLLVCTILLATFLALAKRRHEIALLEENAANHRAILLEYSPYFLDQMIAVVTASTLMAYALYTMSEEVVQKFGTHNLVYTIPFVLYGIFRYLYLVHQKGQGGDPSELMLTDRPLLVCVLLWVVTVWIILSMAG